ncbi:MAG: hypothetical protein ACK5LS_01650 [Propioniciclava sp.]
MRNPRQQFGHGILSAREYAHRDRATSAQREGAERCAHGKAW